MTDFFKITQRFSREELKALVTTEKARSYNGKPGCMCGCRGQYRCSPDYPKIGEFDKVSIVAVTRTANKIIEWIEETSETALQNAIERGAFNIGNACGGDRYISVTTDKFTDQPRVYALYIAN